MESQKHKMKKKIKYRWIAQDRNGSFWAYTTKPKLYLINWSIDLTIEGNEFELLIIGEQLGFVDEIPPNWHKSLKRYWGLSGIITRLWIALIKYYNS